MRTAYRNRFRKLALGGLLGLCALSLNSFAESSAVQTGSSSKAQLTGLHVYKSPTCGCCTKWVEHLEKSSFSVDYENVADTMGVKDKFGIAPKYRSCHTAVSADGYVFEGHVPAKFIRRFLKEKPKGAIGLAVPGMPMGSPGMEVDSEFSPYQVLVLMKDGRDQVYATVKTYQSQF